MRKLVLFALITVPACADDPSAPDLDIDTSAIQVIERGPTCADLGLGDRELVLEHPTAGIHDVDGVTQITLGFDETGAVFWFTSSGMRFDAVLAHAGDKTAVWDFGYEVNGYGSLFAPTEPGTWPPPPPEVISFCYDYDLLVNPNAYAAYGRRHLWSIEKTGLDASLTLAEGQTYLAAYDVTVSLIGTEDVGLSVDGPVFVHNQTPFDAQLDGLTVDVGEIPADLTCPVAFPWTLASGSMLECSYHADVPDTADRMVTVTLQTPEGTVVSTELASFSQHTTYTNLIDECVKVVDDHVGFLGTACADPGTATFHYLMELGPFDACGPFEVDNVASFEGIDTGAGGSDTWTVGGEVPCAGGCSLTQGYWKTHSEHGPAPYDDTWASLADGADTIFFRSGLSYYRALWTAPQGNAYWNLAHQYIAAQLNGLDGADLSSVQSTFDTATSLLSIYAPRDLANKGPIRTAFLNAASTLDQYNNGSVGPGHCDE